MPTITNPWKLYLRSNRRRRPSRVPNPPTLLLNTPGPVNLTPTPSLPNPFIIISASGDIAAQLKFWTANDGTNGRFPNGTFIEAKSPQPGLTTAQLPQEFLKTGPNDITVTSWYFPIAIPGLPGRTPPETSIIDDAFSVAKGDFIDDIFVTAVAPDPNNVLNTSANDAGVVDTTTSAETLQAETQLPLSNEPFLQWVSIDAGIPAGNSNTLLVPQGSGGIAVAIYQTLGGDDDYCARLVLEEKQLVKKLLKQRQLLQQLNLTRLERQHLLDGLAELNDQFVNLELELRTNCGKH